MRARFVAVVGATSSLVLVAFLVPLAVFVRSAAANRAMAAATVHAQSLAPTVAAARGQPLESYVAEVNRRSPYQTSVFLPDGTVVGFPAPRSAAVVAAMAGSSAAAVTEGGREVVVAVAGLPDGTAVVRTFVADEQLRVGVNRSWTVLGLLGFCLLVVSLLVADVLARLLIQPLAAVAGVSHRLAGGDLAARAADVGPPEVRQVSAGLNLLAARITELLAQERKLVADLSHRLRTPLTAARIDAEAIADRDQRSRMIADLEAVDRTVDAVIHEANRPVPEGGAASCDAAPVVGDRARFWSALAEEEGRRMSVTVEPFPVRVRVTEGDLAACVDALIGNVFRHTPEGTGFSVTLTGRSEGGGRLVVSDCGAGLPDGLVLRRGASGSGSTGLGLDIVTGTARRSGGTVLLGRSPAGGASVTVDLGPPERGPIRHHRLRPRRRDRRRGLSPGAD